ncbi:hypothetical protein [Chryseobacterium contaminans]|uniref:NACHT domain-containing protein n=1 Tax=Chryseobacterium contaminans TaxID=1423959 RepID=UPI0030187BCE
MDEKTTFELAKYLGEKLKNIVEPKLKQIISNKIIEYTTGNAKKFSYIKTILHKENVLLSKIYFPLKLKTINNIDLNLDIHNFDSFLEKVNNVTIIANGGSGKTTFIKKFYIECVVKSYKIPVIFNFRDFNEIEISKNTKKKKITENYMFIAFSGHLIFNKIGLDPRTLEKMFESGEFIFFLDGYDELDSEIKNIITKDFTDFVTKFSKNKFILTTRPFTAATNLEGFTNIYLSGIEGFEQIKIFIKKQLFNNEELASAIINTLKLKTNSKYLELLNNPLFLILFMNSYESYPKIPPKKSQFYWQVFDALFEKHETYSKSGYRRPKLSKLEREKFEFLLNAFAFISYFQNLFNFTQLQFESIIRDIIKNYKINLNIENYLEDLKVAMSLIIEDGNILSFIHRSIQEYFAARYIFNLNEDTRKDFLKELAAKHNHKGLHTFLLELISELYPYEFKKYYIKEHINQFYKSNQYKFENDISMTQLEGSLKNVINSFKNFKEILFYSKEFTEIFNKFIRENTFTPNDNINLIISGKSIKDTQIATEILILNENKLAFFDLIDNFIVDIDNSNKPLIDFAFKSHY